MCVEYRICLEYLRLCIPVHMLHVLNSIDLTWCTPNHNILTISKPKVPRLCLFMFFVGLFLNMHPWMVFKLLPTTPFTTEYLSAFSGETQHQGRKFDSQGIHALCELLWIKHVNVWVNMADWTENNSFCWRYYHSQFLKWNWCRFIKYRLHLIAFDSVMSCG